VLVGEWLFGDTLVSFASDLLRGLDALPTWISDIVVVGTRVLAVVVFGGGFVWALLKPLTMFLVLMGVFSFVFSNTAQYRLSLILGLFLYEFFQEGTRTGLESLRAKGYLLTKARFPSWVVVVTSISNDAGSISNSTWPARTGSPSR